MRGIACGVWFRSSSRTESRMPSREAAQLGVSGLGSHVAAKRAGAERREADFCRRATAERHAKKPTVVRETKGGVGARACVLPEMHKCPRAPCGRKHLPGSGLDVFRVRRWCGVRVQRSHRRTLSTKSDECRAGGTRASLRRVPVNGLLIHVLFSWNLWLGTRITRIRPVAQPPPAGLVIDVRGPRALHAQPDTPGRLTDTVLICFER